MEMATFNKILDGSTEIIYIAKFLAMQDTEEAHPLVNCNYSEPVKCENAEMRFYGVQVQISYFDNKIGMRTRTTRTVAVERILKALPNEEYAQIFKEVVKNLQSKYRCLYDTAFVDEVRAKVFFPQAEPGQGSFDHIFDQVEKLCKLVVELNSSH